MNIVLIGFMGSGKSTVAKILSKQLGFALVEMDDLVYHKTHTRCMHEVFAKGGELLLRETEIAIAKEYARKQNQVISSGGGVVLNKIVLDYFKEAHGKVIFLNARFHTISHRIAEDSVHQVCNIRPLFRDIHDAQQLYDFRLALYTRYADVSIDVEDRSADNIAMHIQQLLAHGL